MSRKGSKRRSEVRNEDIKPSTTKLIEDEESATGTIGLGVYYRYFKNIGLGLSITVLVSNIVYQGASVYSNGKSNFGGEIS